MAHDPFRKPLLSSVATFVVALAMLSVFALFTPSTADSLRSISADGFQGVDIVHFASNAFYRWRIDPFLLSGAFMVERLSGLPLGPALAVFALALFAAGLTRRELSTLGGGGSAGRHAAAAILGSGALLALLGSDTAVLCTLAYLPLFVLALERAQNRPDALSLAGVVVLAGALCWSANQLAPIAVALALLTCRTGPVQPATAALFIPAALAAAGAGMPDLPMYPADAHLVPIVPPLSRALPLLSAEIAPPLIDRIHFRAVVRPVALLLTVFAVVLVPRRSSVERRASVVALLLFAFCSWETLSSSLPRMRFGALSELWRLIPNLSALSPWPAALGLGFGVAILAHRGRASLVTSFSALLCVAASLVAHPLLQSPGDQRPLREWLAVSPDEQRQFEPLVFSPSYFVVKEWGLRIFGAWSEGTPRSPLAGEVTLSASGSAERLGALLDGDPQTRWSSEGGQRGEEHITVCFPTPRNVTALELASGAFGTDFPRAVRYCATPNSTTPCEEATSIFETRDWQGAVAFTAAGHPYFRGQDAVVLPIFSSQPVSCLRVEQRTRASFDWSVAELRVGEADPR